MQYLSQQQFDFYNEQGYLLFENAFSETELALIEKELEELEIIDWPGKLLEEDGRTRSILGLHQMSSFFKDLGTDLRLVGPILSILQEEIYLYQSKINYKHRFTNSGGQWVWHQDSFFWMTDDGMPKPIALNICILLDDVTEFNAPLSFIPGTHKEETFPFREPDENPEAYIDKQYFEQSGGFAVKGHKTWYNSVITDLAQKNGIVAPKAKRGTVLLFSGNTFHSSTNNGSPFNRRIVFYTYNTVKNQTPRLERARPDYYASRDFSPIVPRHKVGLNKPQNKLQEQV